MPWLDLSRKHMEKARRRRAEALRRAEEVCRYLCSLGAREVYIFGSLLTEDFREHSDIDFGVSGLPFEHIYKVESKIEEILGGRALDLVYMEYAPGNLTKSIREKGKRYAGNLP